LSWSREFEDRVPGLQTLRDAANYIERLPRSEQQSPHWQAAVEALIMAAEGRGPMLHATVGMRRALNAGKSAEPVTSRKKRVKVYKIITSK
jgi:hypothetical protein